MRIREARPRRLLIALVLAATPLLAACHDKETLERSRVEMVTVDGRKMEVRIAPTGVPDEYRLVVVRATAVIRPDAEFEHQRNWKVARPFIDRTCKGRPYQTLDDTLIDKVNLQIRFRCQA